MLGLHKLIERLKDLPDEAPIEPELKTTANKERDKDIKWDLKSTMFFAVPHSPAADSCCAVTACREQQDLSAGAVLQAVVQKGSGDNNPKEGDLVSASFTRHASTV